MHLDIPRMYQRLIPPFSKKKYKTRFKTWGLVKNLGASYVPEMVQELVNAKTPAETDEEPTALVIRGHEFNPAKVERYLKRNRDFRSAVGRLKTLAPKAQRLRSNQGLRTIEQLQHRLSSSNALSPRIESPDDVRLPEAVIHISSQFVAGSCESIWAGGGAASNFFYSAAIIDWFDNIVSATTLTQRGFYKQAFDLVNICLDQFKYLLINPTPTLFIGVYVAVLWLPPDIAQRFLSYAAQLSTIVLPENHPLRLIWAKLSRAGVKQVSRHSWLILRSHLQILEERFPDSEKVTLELNNLVCNHLNALHLGLPDAIETWQREIIRRSELSGCTESVLQSKLSLAWAFCLSGNHDEVCIKLETSS
jgi:hypothetical protein